MQGEAAPQRLRTAQVATRLEVPVSEKDALTDRKIDDLTGVAKTSPDRRFRSEAIMMLGFARFKGTPSQRERIEATLAELTASADGFLSGNARWSLELRRGDLEVLRAGAKT